MTLDIVELQRLCDEAWPPPWEKFGNTVTLKLKGGIVHTITLPGDHQTLAFIAASRTVVPALLARLQEAEKERDILSVAYAYADHLPSCPAIQYMNGTCDCGYRKVAQMVEATLDTTTVVVAQAREANT